MSFIIQTRPHRGGEYSETETPVSEFTGVLSADGLIRDEVIHDSPVKIICDSTQTNVRANLFYHNQIIMVDDTRFTVLADSDYYLPSPANVPIGARVCYYLYNKNGDDDQDVVIYEHGADGIRLSVEKGTMLIARFDCIAGDGGTTKFWALRHEMKEYHVEIH